MNNKFSLSLVCSALLLAGCGDNSKSSGDSTAAPYSDAINQSLARSSKISFTLLGSEADVPLPSFFLFDTNDHTLNIPLDANSTGLLNDPKVAMGEVDGWSTIMPFTINVNLPIDRTLKNDVVMNETTPFSAHLNDGVKLAKVDVDLSTGVMSNFTALTAGVDYLVVSRDFKTINILPLKGLDPSSDYIYALTDSIVDSADEPLGTSSSYAALKTTDIDQAGSLDLPQKIIHQVEALFAGYGEVSSSDEIIYSSWFTTASAGNVMQKTKAAIATSINPEIKPDGVWKGTANPNNISKDDLNSLYAIDADDTGVNFGDAVTNDPLFSSAFGTDSAVLLKDNYDELLTKASNLDSIEVYRGTVKLPYFLSDQVDGDAWKMQPWRSGMPSIFKILNTLSSGSDADKAAISEQLIALGFTSLPDQLLIPQYQALLVGSELTLANGNQLDAERILTQYSAVPQIRAVKEVPFIMFVPKGIGTDNVPLLQYQHGITNLKESAYALALSHISTAVQTGKTPYALIAIDQPLHGQRGLSEEIVTTPSNPTVFMNLEYLPVARDNIRQGAIDGMGLRYAMNYMAPSEAAFSTVNEDNVSLIGHSIGAITGISSYAVANTSLNNPVDPMFSYTTATLANPGGGIAPFLLESGEFAPVIKHSVVASSIEEYAIYWETKCIADRLKPGDCFNKFYGDVANKSTKSIIDETLASFTYAAQTVLDNVDPLNMASQVTGSVLGIQANGDSTIPNQVSTTPTAGTEPLFKKLGLVNSTSDTSGTRVASYFDESSNAKHSTVITPGSAAEGLAHAEMSSQIVQFTLTNGNSDGSLSVTSGLLDASK